MPPHSYPSIQDFFQNEVPSSPSTSKKFSPNKSCSDSDSANKQGDGFTEEELTEAVNPLARKWSPGREYEEVDVGELVPGTKSVTFMGRVVSFTTVVGRSSKQKGARGWHYVGCRGEGGVVSVSKMR